MIIYILTKYSLTKYFLPTNIFGNYWIPNNNNKNFINVEAIENNWIIKSNYDVQIVTNNVVQETAILSNYQFFYLRDINTKELVILYCTPLYDKTFLDYNIKNGSTIKIGNNADSNIRYASNFIAKEHCTLDYTDGRWIFKTIEKNLVYINNIMTSHKILSNGDTIFIGGLKIIVINDTLIINNPNNLLSLDSNIFSLRQNKMENFIQDEIENEDLFVNFYKEEDYFNRSPRFRTAVEKTVIKIDAPPAKIEEPDKPVIYTIGPMITMSMTSLVMLYTSLNNMRVNNQSINQVIPSIVISGAMLLSVVLWPLLSSNYEKKKKRKREQLRQNKYGEYIEEKRKAIKSAIVVQRQILVESTISTDKCQDIIMRRQRMLWERKLEQDDFLKVRLGIGTVTPDIDIQYPEDHFSLDDDNLKEILQKLVVESKDMTNVPITLSLTEKNITAIVGKQEITKKFIDGLIMQLMTFHGHDELKIVLFTNEQNANKWEYLRYLPHCWDNYRKIRFFATNQDEMKQVSTYLENEFYQRKFTDEKDGQKEQNKDYKSFLPYYLVIVDNLNEANDIIILKNILEQKLNIGFSLLIINDKLSNLPNECSTFINVNEKSSGIFENELVSDKQKEFEADLYDNLNLETCVKQLANIPIEFRSDDKALPENVSFLEMYNVGKIEQLNALNKWQLNSPTLSLQVPVGIDHNNGLFQLDLHEKFHGPHGLIAGMTGSGKSEFIITYILSLAINYHPYEVSFILIDYKGGGLAGAFINRDTGLKLPHLAGVITNLDTIELKRMLTSIESELRRRQKMFNKARDSLGEGTIDIYKYQKLFRDGLVSEPISHLFVICDEFAELKVQQPEFMSQLISIARIGRSLGVHLILATQKPSGVVDDQIWSNSKFRVCLKVQDRSDSVDMIKRPDAALIKQTGRFFLQVGYNEYFAIGQSAWSGAQYFPTDKLRKKVDNSLEFINNTGYTVKKIEENKKIVLESKGEELINIIKYLSQIAESQSIKIDQLWLDRIPNVIYVEELKKKYSYKSEKFTLNPIVGEYDDPNNQKQNLLTLPLSNEGNTIIFGSVGSGKELLLSTIIYSLILHHSVDEVNLYILDFGAETLKSFEEAPQVGDILSVNENEKIDNLFKFLTQQIDERKLLFAEFNGSYRLYCQTSGQTIPTIVVILNNYEAFAETHSKYDDVLALLTREGFKYGIIFVITTSSTGSIRFRLRQNFKQELVLQMNSDTDYMTIFGNARGIVPSKAHGRGLIKLDRIYEFQTAYAFDPDNITAYFKNVSSKLSTIHEKEAFNIPVLPNKVTLDTVKDFLKDLSQVPIGIEKVNLKVDIYDFKKKYSTIISSQDSELFKPFLKGLIKQFTELGNLQIIIIDAEELLTKIEGTIYYNSNFDIIFNQLFDYTNIVFEQYVANNYQRDKLPKHQRIVCIIIGLERFKEKLNPENKNNFGSFFEKGKDLEMINFLLVDTIDKIKRNEIENWYKTVITNNQGIFLGNGIADQFVIKLSKVPRELRDEIPNSFGYSIRNGVATLTKMIEGDES